MIDRAFLRCGVPVRAAASNGTNLYGYAYDTIGNRLWASANADTNAYSANCLNQYASILRASVSPCEPSYDLDGNLTGDGVFTYAYDAENRLVSVTSVEEALWLRISHELYPEGLEYELYCAAQTNDLWAARLMQSLPWRRLTEEDMKEKTSVQFLPRFARGGKAGRRGLTM